MRVDPKRLNPLLIGKIKPQDRSEEVLGYRKTLDLIFKKYKSIEISPASIKKLHKISQGNFSGDAGEWKKKNNEIIEILPSGEQKIRFIPLQPEFVKASMETLCRDYNLAIAKELVPELVAISAFILDFLSIHPFRDGNGRVSRLLSLLLLLKAGFNVGRYVSLERLIESSKERYYDSLLGLRPK